MNVDADFLDVIDRLAKETQSTRSDVIRRALTLYARAVQEAKEGRLLQFVEVTEP